MSRHDDQNRDSALSAIDSLYDRIIELENQLEEKDEEIQRLTNP